MRPVDQLDMLRCQRETGRFLAGGKLLATFNQRGTAAVLAIWAALTAAGIFAYTYDRHFSLCS